MINRDLECLYPPLRARARALICECLRRGLPVRIFETGRTPERQDELKTSGNVTAVGAWGSWHNFMLAFDVAFYIDKKWTWTDPRCDWDEVGKIGMKLGLKWGGRFKRVDKPHFEWDTTGLTTERAKQIYDLAGIKGVWDEISRMQLST